MRLILLPLVVLPIAAGCTGHLNQTDMPLGDPLPDLVGVMPGGAPEDEGPSLPRSGDRSGWTPTVVTVERRQVEAQPAYVTTVNYDKSTARERGEFPTAATVLEEAGDGGMAAWEGLAAPFYAPWDLIVSPVRMFFEPPWSTIRTPADLPPVELPPLATGEGAGIQQ